MTAAGKVPAGDKQQEQQETIAVTAGFLPEIQTPLFNHNEFLDGLITMQTPHETCWKTVGCTVAKRSLQVAIPLALPQFCAPSPSILHLGIFLVVV